MPRKSNRLESRGYYSIEGEPVISYRETQYRLSSHRARRKTNMVNFSLSDSISLSDSDSISISLNDSISDHNSISLNDSNSNRRVSIMFSLKIFGYLFLMLSLCFGFGYLILTQRSNFLDSGLLESTVSTYIANMDLTAEYEEMAKQLRELQNEMQTLKRKMIPQADTLPNFALASQGARVVSCATSKTYKAGLTFFGIPIWCQSAKPLRTVIEGHSRLLPGNCWKLAGGQGHLVIALSNPVTVSHVTLGHISKSLSPTGSIISAPKEFSVYGMETYDDKGTQLGTFLYDQDGDQLQTFKLPDHKNSVYKFVKLQVHSNWGHPEYSCLYSFRVHGKLAD